jgi:hypothetical protein
MSLNVWIGLKKMARERHVFTLQAINQNASALNREVELSFAACAGPRILASRTNPEKD